MVGTEDLRQQIECALQRPCPSICLPPWFEEECSSQESVGLDWVVLELELVLVSNESRAR